MTRLEQCSVIASTLSQETGVERAECMELARNAVQATCWEPEAGEEPVSLEEMLVCCLSHRVTYMPQTWSPVARGDIERLARAAADAVLGGT